MDALQYNKELVAGYIEVIWNNNLFKEIESFLSAGYIDHSLPPGLPPNVTGTEMWITATGQSFKHHTEITDQVTEADKSMIKIKMVLKHVGPWRGIAATNAEIEIVGYRLFYIAGGKITQHWALIDGNAIESQLKAIATGCKVQQ